MQYPDDMVNIFLVNGITAVLSLHHKSNGIPQTHVRINCHDTLPVGHDILGFLIPKFEDIGNHLRLAGLDDPLFMTFIDHIDDLFLRYVCLARISVNAEYPQNCPGRNPDKPGKGHQHLHQDVNRRNTEISPLIRRPCRYCLWEQDSHGKRYV